MEAKPIPYKLHICQMSQPRSHVGGPPHIFVNFMFLFAILSIFVFKFAVKF